MIHLAFLRLLLRRSETGSKGGAPIGAQSLEGHCRKRSQCHAGGCGDELPEAAESYCASL